MARYEHLPIYKQAMDIAVHLWPKVGDLKRKVVAGFSRYHKYTLGSDLRQKSREIVLLIVKANNTRQQRKTVLIQLRNALDELLLLVRLGKEVQAFKSFKAFQFIVELVVSVCKQNEGWLKNTVKQG